MSRSSPNEKILASRKRLRSPSPPNLSSDPRHQKRVRVRHDESVQSLPLRGSPGDLAQQQPHAEALHPHNSETRKRPRSPSPAHVSEDADGEDERPDLSLGSPPSEEFIPPPRLSHKRLRSPSPENSSSHTHPKRKRRKGEREGLLLIEPKHTSHIPDKKRRPKRAQSFSPQRSNKRRKLEYIPKPTQVIYQSEEGVALDVFILVSRLIADKEFSTLFGFYAPKPSSDFYDKSSSLPPPRNDPTVPYIVRNRGIVGTWLEQEASLGRLPLSLLLTETHKRVTRRMLKVIWETHMDEAEQYSYKKCILQLLALYNSRNRPADSERSDSKIRSRARRQRHASASKRALAEPSTSRLSVPDLYEEAQSQRAQASSRFVLVPAHWQEDDYLRAATPFHPYHHAHEEAYPDLHFPSHLRYPYMLPSIVGDHADLKHDPVATLDREISAGFPSFSSGSGRPTTTDELYSFPLHAPSSSPSLVWDEADRQIHYYSGAYTYPQPTTITVRNEHWNTPLPTHKAEELDAGVSVIQASLMREDSSTVSPSEDDPAAAGSLREPCVDSSLESGPDSVPSAAAPEVEGAQLKAESPDTQAEQEVGPFTSFLVSQLLKQEEAPLCVNPADLTLSEEKKDNSGRENSVEAYYESFLNLSWELEDIPPPGPSEEYDGPFPVPPGGDAESYDGPFPLPPGTE